MEAKTRYAGSLWMPTQLIFPMVFVFLSTVGQSAEPIDVKKVNPSPDKFITNHFEPIYYLISGYPEFWQLVYQGTVPTTESKLDFFISS